ncbi:MAG: hypothetical protein ABSF28_23795 [Terracidiphilus sp.]|jgi:hypothetical protein
MLNHVRRAVRRREWARAHEKATLRKLTVLIPRSYNPNSHGVRTRVELSKLVRTFREIRQLSPGYSVQRTDGWYRDRDSKKWVKDHHFRFDIDLLITPSVIAGLSTWKRILERRLEQQSIYMILTKEVTWL